MKPPKKVPTQATQKKRKKTYEHAYAIIRFDAYQAADTPIEDKISVKEILWDADFAKKEVDRLNSLQSGKNVHYFLQITRIERKEIEVPTWSSLPQVTNMVPSHPVAITFPVNRVYAHAVTLSERPADFAIPSMQES